MQIIYSEKHRLRDPATELYGGELVRPFECPERMDHILSRAEAVGLGKISAPDAHGLAPIARIHDAAYLSFLETIWADWQAAGHKGEAIPTSWPSRRMPSLHIPEDIEGKLGYYALAGETSISGGTWEAARASADVALSGAAFISGGASTAFALCRPPGHHAAQDMYGGYCFINNAAVAAQHLRDNGAAKVAILDVDFHHGNGTQAIFYDRADVMFLSLHGDPIHAFPHFLGHREETGEGEGEGFNLNYPMAAGTGYCRWREALDDACREIARFGPDAMVVSLGVDTFKEDPISFFKLESADFTDYGAALAKLGLPTLFVMEGGYAVAEIGINTINVLTGFEGG